MKGIDWLTTGSQKGTFPVHLLLTLVQIFTLSVVTNIWLFGSLKKYYFVNRFSTKFQKGLVNGQFNSQWSPFMSLSLSNGSLREQESKPSTAIYLPSTLSKEHSFNWKLDVPQGERSIIPDHESFLLGEKGIFMCKRGHTHFSLTIFCIFLSM